MIKNLIHLDFKKLKLKNPTGNNWYVPNIQKQTDTEINVAFIQKVLMQLSFPQIDEPYYFPELEF